jgi:NADP-dependent 3-hydroxy acid dehydrogenase YdfG
MQLSGRIAVITGASSGIGAATARELSGAGMKLVLTARRQERLEQLVKELPQAVAVAGDVLDPDLPDRLIQTAVSAWGGCHVVFNNAGVIETGAVETVDVEALCRMVRINVEACFRLAYVTLKYFRTRDEGHLVNTSSILGTKVRPTAGAYAGTKYAIEALSEALRLELAGSRIQISCVEPGLVITELHSRWPVHPKDFFKIQYPLQPEDVARCVRFLLEQPAHVRIPKLMVLPGEQQL